MFFKNSFHIFRSDLRKLSRNWVALVIAVGIALLPSLYAWVNILASWDPYGSTGGVKVGIVNNDEGAKIQNISINIGESLVDQLKDNKKLGWTFFDTADEGVEECRVGNVYATIIIPKDFSAKMATLLDETHVKPQLDYYVNEKLNAIAPKMTDSGASTLQKQITESFIQAVVEKVMEVLNPLGYDLDQHYDEIKQFESLLSLVDGDLPNVNTRLDNLLSHAQDGKIDLDQCQDDVEFLKRVLGNAITMTDDVKSDTDELIDRANHTTAELRANLQTISTALGTLENSLDRLGTTVNDKKPDITTSLATLSADIQTVSTRLSSLENDLGIFQVVQREDLLRKIDALRKTLDSLDDFLDSLSGASDVVTGLTNQIKFLEDSAKKIENQANELSDAVDKAFAEIIAALEKLQNRASITELSLDAVAAKLDQSSALYQQLERTVNDAVARVNRGEDATLVDLKLSTQIGDLINKLETTHSRISEKLSRIVDHAANIRSTAQSLRLFLSSLDQSTERLTHSLQTQIEELNSTLRDINAILRQSEDNTILDFSGDLGRVSQNLKDLSARVSEAERNINDSDALEESVSAARSLCGAARTMTSTLANALDSSLDLKIQTFLNNAKTAGSDLQHLFSMSITGADAVQEFLGKLNSGKTILSEDVEKFKGKFAPYLDDMGEIAAKIKALGNIMDLKDLTSIMQYDSESTSDFFSSPVELNTTKLFPVKNYGAGLTPFYTTLCLWVGTLLMCALFTTHAVNADFPYTPNEEFMGKFFLFGSMALIQGLIAALGDVFVLKVEILHPVLFVCLSMFYSLVFTGIVYTLVALLDNVGKAIGVVFLVLQIAGAGGTFPIQVTPPFFQQINKFLPFTYAINGMREAVAGIVMENLLVDILVLIVYFALFLALGLVLKRFASKSIGRFLKKLSDSGVIGH